MTLLSHVMSLTYFSWQMQYLMKLECHFSWQAQHLRAILEDSRSAKCCMLQYKIRLQDGASKVSEAAGAKWRFHPRIILGLSSNRLYIIILAEAIQGFFAEILNSIFRGRRSNW